jgi:hypothetical protein
METSAASGAPEALSTGQERIMKTAQLQDKASPLARAPLEVTSAHRRTLEEIFRHPSAHNLEWRRVVALIAEIGGVDERPDSEFVFKVAGKRHLMRRPHHKDLTGDETIALRHFLTLAGVSAEPASEPVAQTDPVAPSLLVVVDHHGAKIFHVDVRSDEPMDHVIKPYDPHHFLHHLVHKDQSRERGQRAPEEPAFYEEIGDAVALGGAIVVVGHGEGKSNAAHHLTEYLQEHRPDIYRRIAGEVSADLSSITLPQLLELARQSLRA